MMAPPVPPLLPLNVWSAARVLLALLMLLLLCPLLV
jgi:hypothetical protein